MYQNENLHSSSINSTNSSRNHQFTFTSVKVGSKSQIQVYIGLYKEKCDFCKTFCYLTKCTLNFTADPKRYKK